MTHCFRWAIGALLAVSAAAMAQDGALPVIPKPSPEPTAIVPPWGPEQIWVGPTETLAQTRTRIEVRTEGLIPPGGPVHLDAVVHSQDQIDRCLIRLVIHDASGEARFAADIPIDLKEGPNPVRFTWPAGEASLGAYRARLDVLHGFEGPISAVSIVIRKMASLPLEQKLRETEDVLDAVAPHVARTDDTAPEPSVVAVQYALAEDAIVAANEACLEGDWPRADSLADYVVRTAGAIQLGLTFGGHAERVAEPVATRSLVSLRRQPGGFEAAGRPVILVGASGAVASAPAVLSRYGLQLAVLDLAPDSEALAQAPATLADAARRNIGVVLNPFPEAAFGPFDSDAARTEAQSRIADYLHTVAEMGRQCPTLVGLCLAEQPWTEIMGEGVRAEFIQAVRERYQDIDALNHVWRARLRDFEELHIAWSADPEDPFSPLYINHPAYQYDWHTFHQALTTRWLLAMAEEVRAVAPGIPAFVAPGANAFAVGETRSGVDREALAVAFPINGCTSVSDGEGTFAIGFPEPSMYYHLMRSLAPNKPLVDVDLRIPVDPHPYAEGRYDRVYSILWQAAMAGVNAMGIHGDGVSFGGRADVFAFPECVEAIATARADLNRLALAIAAFQTAPPHVAILWSMPSKIFLGGEEYLESLRSAYQGSAFFGAPVGFITERQCAEGALESVRVLIVPQTSNVREEAFQAIGAFARTGGVIIRHGGPIPYDERGLTRSEMLDVTTRTLLMRVHDTPQTYLQALDTVYSLEKFGLDSAFPRLTTEDGYPLDGVVSRAVVHDGAWHLYVLNIRHDAVHASLHADGNAGTDLIRGQEVSFPMRIEPLRPMLIRLNDVPLPTPPVLVAEEEPRIPAAVLEPVPPPPGPEPRPFRLETRRKGSRPAYPPEWRPTPELPWGVEKPPEE